MRELEKKAQALLDELREVGARGKEPGKTLNQVGAFNAAVNFMESVVLYLHEYESEYDLDKREDT